MDLGFNPMPVNHIERRPALDQSEKSAHDGDRGADCGHHKGSLYVVGKEGDRSRSGREGWDQQNTDEYGGAPPVYITSIPNRIRRSREGSKPTEYRTADTASLCVVLADDGTVSNTVDSRVNPRPSHALRHCRRLVHRRLRGSNRPRQETDAPEAGHLAGATAASRHPDGRHYWTRSWMKGAGGMVLVAALVVGCATDPKPHSPMDGQWSGSATAGSTITVTVSLLPENDTEASGFATFTVTAGPAMSQSYQTVTAILTGTDAVTIAFSGSASGPPAFFEGHVSGVTMTGLISGGGFPSAGTAITLTRKAGP